MWPGGGLECHAWVLQPVTFPTPTFEIFWAVLPPMTTSSRVKHPMGISTMPELVRSKRPELRRCNIRVRTHPHFLALLTASPRSARQLERVLQVDKKLEAMRTTGKDTKLVDKGGGYGCRRRFLLWLPRSSAATPGIGAVWHRCLLLLRACAICAFTAVL